MSVASNSRLAYWDNWKGIAIIAVVMIHATTQAFQFSIESFNFSFAMVLRQFINYAVPVFLALAGYFAFTPKRKEKIGFYYKSRAKRILLPYAIWTAIYLILKTPTVAPDFNEIIEGYLFGTGIGIGYFVIVLIQFVLITPFLLKIDSLKIHFSIMLVLTFFGLAFTYYFKVFNTSSFFSNFPGGGLPFFVWYPFYHLGFVIAKYKRLVDVSKIRISLCNPPEKSQQLFIENSIKINSRSFLCVNQNSLIARYWRSSNKMKMVCPFQSSVESMA